MNLTDIINVASLEPIAAEVLPPDVWNYIAGGAGDEHTLRWNDAAWNDIQLSPRNMVDVSTIDTTISLLGNLLQHPILLAPVATHASYHPRGELETLDGAKAARTLWTQSTLSSLSVEECGGYAQQIDQPWLMQVYLQTDRGFTRDFVQRAVSAGACGLILTVDTPSLGARDRDRRNNLGAAHGATYPNLDGLPVAPDQTPTHQRLYNPHLAADATWEDLEWLDGLVDVPVLVKGVLRSDESRRALDHGAAGIIVSNHGARNLDTVPATATALPRVVDAVAGDAPVLVDGGIRRGTDVVKALAMGADAVLIGRPYIWGLASFGSAGVAHVVEMLETELSMAMALLGVPTIGDLSRDALWA